ncbi:RICIN domain-containing protein [Streptomyces violascens]|uniref:RICIN domain-containing protein n=1 Tax=Streptomyces violascens TaxID=67381 RepID=UPI003676B893
MYRIVSKQTGKCIDVARGHSSHVGDYLNIWDCHPWSASPAARAATPRTSPWNTPTPRVDPGTPPTPPVAAGLAG